MSRLSGTELHTTHYGWIGLTQWVDRLGHAGNSVFSRKQPLNPCIRSPMGNQTFKGLSSTRASTAAIFHEHLTAQPVDMYHRNRSAGCRYLLNSPDPKKTTSARIKPELYCLGLMLPEGQSLDTVRTYHWEFIIRLAITQRSRACKQR